MNNGPNAFDILRLEQQPIWRGVDVRNAKSIVHGYYLLRIDLST
jgi:hypothetical protein